MTAPPHSKIMQQKKRTPPGCRPSAWAGGVSVSSFPGDRAQRQAPLPHLPALNHAGPSGRTAPPGRGA